MTIECKAEKNLSEDDGVVVTMDGSMVPNKDLFNFDNGQSFAYPVMRTTPISPLHFPFSSTNNGNWYTWFR